MTISEAKALYEIIVDLGVPAALGLVMLYFMFAHIRKEGAKGPGDSDCPPWAREAKAQILDLIDRRLTRVESAIKSELHDQEAHSRERDLRQQRIENLLTEIRAMLAPSRRR